MGLLEKGEIRNCVSEETLRELVVALSYPKLSFSYKTQADILEFVLAHSDLHEPKERLAVARDPEDNKFIECAVSSHARVLITGDKGLLSVKHYPYGENTYGTGISGNQKKPLSLHSELLILPS